MTISSTITPEFSERFFTMLRSSYATAVRSPLLDEQDADTRERKREDPAAERARSKNQQEIDEYDVDLVEKAELCGEFGLIARAAAIMSQSKPSSASRPGKTRRT